MGIPQKNQSFQDWITQQWVILFGRKIDKKENDWLLGPFGSTDGIGLKFINQLAEKENLIIDKNKKYKGLIQSINQLNLSEEALNVLSKDIIDFYENTANYDFDLKVNWNPFFKGCGILLKILFSNRIEQLNVPIETRTKQSFTKKDEKGGSVPEGHNEQNAFSEENIKNSKSLKSEIIHL